MQQHEHIIGVGCLLLDLMDGEWDGQLPNLEYFSKMCKINH